MRRTHLASIILATLAIGFLTAGPVGAQAVSTAGDQTALEVTVYNSNLGLIKDTRRLNLPPGRGELRFMDVAAQIIPETVHVKPLKSPDAFHVLEQNYEYDLISPNKLLDKYVGRKIKIVDFNEYQDRKTTVEAELLSNNEGQVYRINGEIFLGHPGYKVLPQLPEDLIARPTLSWILEGGPGGAQQAEASYLTGGISWKADYVMVLDQDDAGGDLSGWVTLNNQSGATYKDARLKLVAGQVNRAPEPRRRAPAAAGVQTAPAPPPMEGREFFEYHIYTLPRPTTIKNKQQKQVSLLSAQGLSMAKELMATGRSGWFMAPFDPRQSKIPVEVFLRFKNSKENKLGMALPGGVMRVYKKDHQNSLQFVGEDRLEHTPRDEEIRLKLGQAFDVVCERVQSDYKKISSRQHESEWTIHLRNHKKTRETVALLESFPDHWEMISNSQPFKKVSASTVRFEVDLPADGEVKLAYRVRVGI